MHSHYNLIYLACALAWSVIETQLTLGRIESDQKHWLQRSMKAVRRWSDKRSTAVSVGGRIMACFGLSLAAWIPELLTSAVWPLALVVYVVVNLKSED